MQIIEKIIEPEISHPACPIHGTPLDLKQNTCSLWICTCPHTACAKAGYGWQKSAAYLDFHRANNLKPS